MRQDMTLAAAAGGEALHAMGACEGLLTSVGAKMLLQSALLIPALSTTRVFAHKRLLASMCSLMDDLMSRTEEAFATMRITADVGFASLMMTSKVVYKVALGRKCSTTIGVGAHELFFIDVMFGNR